MTIESSGTSSIYVSIFEQQNSTLRITYDISVSYIGPCDPASLTPTTGGRYYTYYWQNRTLSCSSTPCSLSISTWPNSDYLVTVTSVVGNIRAATISEAIRTPPTGKTIRFHTPVQYQLIFPTVAPWYGYPPRVTSVEVVDMTTLAIEWEEVECIFQRGRPLNYTLRYGIYDELSGAVNYSITIDNTNTAYVVADLIPNTIYVFEVAAYNMVGATQFYYSNQGYLITDSGTLEEILLVASKYEYVLVKLWPFVVY